MVTPKGRMNPQPSGMTVPVDSRMGMDEGWVGGAANADWSGGGIDWRNQDIYTVKPSDVSMGPMGTGPVDFPYDPTMSTTSEFLGPPDFPSQETNFPNLFPTIPQYGNFLKGAGGAVADIGRSFFDPTSWRWGEEQYNPAFQPDQSDPMAQRAGYGLISGMTAGMPEGPPDFQKMSDFDMAMHLTDVVDPSGIGGDVARLGVKAIPEGTLAATAGVMMQRAKNKLKGSKVVDPKGTPIRVYHGGYGVFDEFDPQFLLPGSLRGKGFHFTESAPIAGEYSLMKGFQDPTTGAYKGDPNIHATYLNLQNPLDLSRVGGTKDDVVENMSNQIFEFANSVEDRASNLNSLKKIIRNRNYELATDYDTTAIDNFIANRQFDKAEKELVNFLKQTSKTNERVFLVVDDWFKTIENSEDFQSAVPYLGEEVWNKGLRELGYDGMTMIGTGGRGVGGEKHRVWVAFDEKSIFPFAELEGMRPNLPPSGDFSKMLENIFKAGMGR